MGTFRYKFLLSLKDKGKELVFILTLDLAAALPCS